jgi:hypothetical protein
MAALPIRALPKYKRHRVAVPNDFMARTAQPASTQRVSAPPHLSIVSVCRRTGRRGDGMTRLLPTWVQAPPTRWRPLPPRQLHDWTNAVGRLRRDCGGGRSCTALDGEAADWRMNSPVPSKVLRDRTHRRCRRKISVACELR